MKAGLPCAGAPVTVGTMDAWGGMFGTGVIADGDAMYQSGTSEIPGIVSAAVHPTPGVIVFPPYDGITLHAAPTQAGGAALAWLGNVMGKTPAQLSGLVERVAPSDAVPLFLPHLQGERAPLWDSASRGVFARIDGRAGPGAQRFCIGIEQDGQAQVLQSHDHFHVYVVGQGPGQAAAHDRHIGGLAQILELLRRRARVPGV